MDNVRAGANYMAITTESANLQNIAKDSREFPLNCHIIVGEFNIFTKRKLIERQL